MQILLFLANATAGSSDIFDLHCGLNLLHTPLIESQLKGLLHHKLVSTTGGGKYLLCANKHDIVRIPPDFDSIIMS